VPYIEGTKVCEPPVVIALGIDVGKLIAGRSMPSVAVVRTGSASPVSSDTSVRRFLPAELSRPQVRNPLAEDDKIAAHRLPFRNAAAGAASYD
jgi:hypothetical protein